MPRTDRLGMTVSLVVLGLAPVACLCPCHPPVVFSLTVLGSDLTLRLSGSNQLAIVMTALVCAGTDAIVRAHPTRLWPLDPVLGHFLGAAEPAPGGQHHPAARLVLVGLPPAGDWFDRARAGPDDYLAVSQPGSGRRPSPTGTP